MNMPTQQKKLNKALRLIDLMFKNFQLALIILPIPDIVFKAQFSEQIYAQDNLDNTRSFSLSMGYYFSI